MANFTPLGERVVVKPSEGEQTTKGGIYLPDTAKEKPQEGKVVAVGVGRPADDGKLIKPTVKRGDRVLFGKYSGNEVQLDGTEHVIMREDDILGVLEG